MSYLPCNPVESGVLPQQAHNPTHISLDGRRTGPHGSAAFRFKRHGNVWKINADTHYDPLKLAYDSIANDSSYDPFVEMPTRETKGISHGICLKLKQGSENMFIYLMKRKRK